MNLSDSVPDLFNFHLFRSQPLPSSLLNCCPIQVELQPTNDCPASTHHVNPTTALIRLSRTEWCVHGVCTPLQHPRFLTVRLLLYNPQPPSDATAFIVAAAISKAFTVLTQKAITALSLYYNNTRSHAYLWHNQT
ncbi:predicted protein [Lichtheimia corymbifera JMRC:FSU:9682]|uniref:Uncharacterized protein n=1 Tax=Lichtheimia corymbifera JMRC:FSU:9682 TaxID=1263082 RepID=A0A068S917_9FUNG|nr:predicted protein [Lichtheimia corymbifera JMRC:FSU:9682]